MQVRPTSTAQHTLTTHSHRKQKLQGFREQRYKYKIAHTIPFHLKKTALYHQASTLDTGSPGELFATPRTTLAQIRQLDPKTLTLGAALSRKEVRREVRIDEVLCLSGGISSRVARRNQSS